MVDTAAPELEFTTVEPETIFGIDLNGSNSEGSLADIGFLALYPQYHPEGVEMGLVNIPQEG